MAARPAPAYATAVSSLTRLSPLSGFGALSSAVPAPPGPAAGTDWLGRSAAWFNEAAAGATQTLHAPADAAGLSAEQLTSDFLASLLDPRSL